MNDLSNKVLQNDLSNNVSQENNAVKNKLKLTEKEFCEGFFHISKNFEWKQNTQCLMACECQRYTCYGVAHLSCKNETLYLEKYKSKYIGNTNDNIHVEYLIKSDLELTKTIYKHGDSHNLVLTLFLTYQPCHHSLGGRRSKSKHQQSCCDLIYNWYKTVLEPLHVVLNIKCCDLYRIHWENEDLFKSKKDVDIFTKKTTEGKNGLLQLVKEPNIHMTSMSEESWKFLLNDDKFNISEEQWTERFKHDQHIQEFIQTKFGVLQERL